MAHALMVFLLFLFSILPLKVNKNRLSANLSSKEIKCPHCKQWTLWGGNLHDRCLYCNGFLETDRFTVEVEKKIRNEFRTENDPLFINPTDTPNMRHVKTVLQFLRAWLSYLQIAFFTFISLLLLILGIIAA
jgi:hypothetical protein